jgi:hypothetical protein
MRYTVWVGGGEVTDYYVDLETAKRIANHWLSEGYDDVSVEEIE